MPSESKEEPNTKEMSSSNDTDTHTPELAVKHDSNSSRRKTDTSSGSSFQHDSEDILAAVPDVEVDLENGEGTELKRKILNIIPRDKRRGLLAQLAIGIPEIDDPIQYSPNTKNFIIFIIAIVAIAAPMGYRPPFFLR
jgi:hypothetical protein